MNIVREDQANLTSLLKVNVGEADYAQEVDKILRDYKKKVNVPGFRPGMVPMGIVKKLYLKGAVAEQSYKTASQAAFKYLEDNKIDYIGDILPSETQSELDFENASDFEFVFEFATTPEVKIDLTAKDSVTRFTINVTDDMLASYRENYLRRYGRLVDVDVVEKDEALTVTLDNESMNVEDAYVGLVGMSDAERAPFIGKKVGDVMDVDVNELYSKPSQRAAILQVKEGELEGIDPKFKLTITKIRKFAEPEMNEEFFKMAFPDGNITDEKGLNEYLTTQIQSELGRETEYLLTGDIRDLLVRKADLTMPADFLKRWLFVINEGKFTMEDIEKDFDQFLDMMRWNVIQQHYTKTLELKVSEEDMFEEAKVYVRMQLAQYGMGNATDEMLTEYAASVLKNKEEARRIYERMLEKKVISAVEPMVKIKDKNVSTEEFGKEVESRRK